jgi:hypothetical protein
MRYELRIASILFKHISRLIKSNMEPSKKRIALKRVKSDHQ